MNTTNENRAPQEFGGPEIRLEAATRAILAESVPADACRRVQERAVRLAATRNPAPRSDGFARPHRSFSRRAVQCGLLAAAAAVAVIASLLPFSSRPALALDELFDAVRRQPWIHATTTVSHDQEEWKAEFWVSNQKQFSLVKSGDSVQLEDWLLGTSLKYDPADGNVYRLDSSTSNSRNLLVERLRVPGLLDRLLDRSDPPRQIFPDERIIASERDDETQPDRKSVEYRVRLQRVDNPRISRTLQIRVDVASGLPDLWEESHSDGSREAQVVTRFDYPATGPGDIYALGVPRTAPLIDRVPRGELARIVTAHRAGRRRFDDYDAVVVRRVEARPVNYRNLLNLDVRRVRRKGNRYRVDQFLFAQPDLEAPPEWADMRQWWLRHRYEYWSVPLQICDGKRVSTYRMVDDKITTFDKPPNLAVALLSQQPVRPPADDPPVDWAELMPETCSRPRLWTDDVGRKFEVDANGGDGPAETVRVAVTRITGKAAAEIGRFWFDPARDFILRKGIVSGHSEEQYEEFVQSPGGQWFARCVRCRALDDPGQPRWVREYNVDFDAELADELFEPLAQIP